MDSADNAWVMVSSALVFMMTPGLAMFYGGMTRSQHVLSTMMHSFFLLALASLVWALWGFSLAFDSDAWFGMVGGLKYLGLGDVYGSVWSGTTIPSSTFVIFQCGFAVITAALISGAFAERMNFGPFILFMTIWLTVVYSPVCHWVWGPNGWLANMGILDFAGGTVVHVNSGMSALAMCLVLGKRKGYGKLPMIPHNIPLTLIGVSLLWIGWFGFNAGSAMKANESASMAFLATQLATAAAVMSWVFTEWAVSGKPTVLGMASGAVAGLVAITPAAGYVSPMHAITIGIFAGIACYFGVLAKNWVGYDDSLDVFGIHAVGGIVGSIATGIFASKAIGGTDGWLYGNSAQLGSQITGVLAVASYSFIATFIIAAAMNFIMYLRVPEEDELTGTDTSIHGETGYTI